MSIDYVQLYELLGGRLVGSDVAGWRSRVRAAARPSVPSAAGAQHDGPAGRRPCGLLFLPGPVSDDGAQRVSALAGAKQEDVGQGLAGHGGARRCALSLAPWVARSRRQPR
eukprot:COSAG01_NODE_392_length_17668_cov_5.382264_13_plen_111_part_00